MNMQKEKHLITCPEIFITSHITFPNGNRVCMIEVKGVFTVKSQPLPYCLSHFSDAKLNFFLKNPRKLKIGNEKKNYVHHVYINCSSLPPTKLTLYWKKIFWWKGLLTWSIGVHSPMLELFIFLSPLSTQKTRWNLPGSWRAYSTHRFSIHHGETERCLRSFVIGLLKHEASSKPLVLCVYTKSDSSSETHEDSVLTEILTE